MDRRAWWDTVHGVAKESDTTKATEQACKLLFYIPHTMKLYLCKQWKPYKISDYTFVIFSYFLLTSNYLYSVLWGVQNTAQSSGEGNGTPLQYSCLENPMDGGAWWAAESDTTEQLHFHFSLSCIGEGNGNPLLCSCLENPRDGGAWWAAVSGVAQSRTQLKWLRSSNMGNAM